MILWGVSKYKARRVKKSQKILKSHCSVTNFLDKENRERAVMNQSRTRTANTLTLKFYPFIFLIPLWH